MLILLLDPSSGQYPTLRRATFDGRDNR